MEDDRIDAVRYPWTSSKNRAAAAMIDDVKWCKSIKGAVVEPEEWGLVSRTFDPVVYEGSLDYTVEDKIVIGGVCINDKLAELFDEHDGQNIRVTIEIMPD